MHPRFQKEIIEDMLEDDLRLINSGIFEFKNKKYTLHIEVKEVKPRSSELSSDAEKCYASGCNNQSEADGWYCEEHKI